MTCKSISNIRVLFGHVQKNCIRVQCKMNKNKFQAPELSVFQFFELIRTASEQYCIFYHYLIRILQQLVTKNQPQTSYQH